MHLEKLNINSDFFKNKMKRLKTKVISHDSYKTSEFTAKRSPNEITLKNFKKFFSHQYIHEIKDYYFYFEYFDAAFG